MLKSRREAADLQQQYDIKCGPSAAASVVLLPAMHCNLFFMPIVCLNSGLITTQGAYLPCICVRRPFTASCWHSQDC